MKTVADGLRWGLILGIWGFVTYTLWGIGWGWAALWAIPGFFIVLNVVGFATLPLYFLIARISPEFKEYKRLLEKMGQDPDSD